MEITEDKILKEFENNGLPNKLEFWSRTLYSIYHPESEVYFDSVIFIEENVVWEGDIDFTLDREKLEKVSKKLKKKLYIVSKSDLNQKTYTKSWIMKNSKKVIKPYKIF